MEPLSAHGLPRLSWIDTLYSSMYPTVHLSQHIASLLSSLVSLCHGFLFTSSPPSPAHGLPVRDTSTAICRQHIAVDVESTFPFPLDFQLAGITVAVHYEMVNSPTLTSVTL